MSADRAQAVVITVDGPAAAGKTSTSLAIAAELHLRYVETGRLYRILACEALRQNVPITDHTAFIQLCDTVIANSTDLLSTDTYSPQDLRSEAVTLATTEISAIAAVRSSITELLRTWVHRQRRWILEGRDLGTVVFPDAQLKFYLTAEPETRAQRRFRQDGQQPYEDILRAVLRRDEADSSRTVAPMTPATDAILLDTTTLTVEEVVAHMLAAYRDKLGHTIDLATKP